MKKCIKECLRNLDIEWSSVIKLGLEQELLKLYDLGEREKYEKDRDNNLQNLFYIKQRLKNVQFYISKNIF